MNRLIYLIIIFAGILLHSCAENISIGNANEFKKGMTYNESGLDKFIVNKNYTYNFKLGRDSYSTISYEYQIEKNKYTYFSFIFRNDRLLFWGYPDELNKDEFPELNSIGDTLCKQLKYNLDN